MDLFAMLHLRLPHLTELDVRSGYPYGMQKFGTILRARVPCVLLEDATVSPIFGSSPEESSVSTTARNIDPSYFFGAVSF